MHAVDVAERLQSRASWLECTMNHVGSRSTPRKSVTNQAIYPSRSGKLLTSSIRWITSIKTRSCQTGGKRFTWLDSVYCHMLVSRDAHRWHLQSVKRLVINFTIKFQQQKRQGIHILESPVNSRTSNHLVCFCSSIFKALQVVYYCYRSKTKIKKILKNRGQLLPIRNHWKSLDIQFNHHNESSQQMPEHKNSRILNNTVHQSISDEPWDPKKQLTVYFFILVLPIFYGTYIQSCAIRKYKPTTNL